MSRWGNLKVGRIDLRETYTASQQVNAQTAEQSLVLNGTETTPPLALAALRARRDDLLQLRNTLQAVTFSSKTDFSGYYFVKDAGASVVDWYDVDRAAGFDWGLTLIPFGPGNAVDLESRLTGVVRVNDFALSGTRWHAPAVGHYGYFLGSGGVPGTIVTRTAENGLAVKVYLAIPSGVDPRWGCDPAGYLDGRVSFVQGTVERAGTGIVAAATDWTLSNGLVRVQPKTAGGLLSIDAWGAGAWSAKAWDVTLAGVAITPAQVLQLTVLRNDPEGVMVRLLAVTGTSGRTLIDLLLRRGSRFVEVYVQHSSSVTIGLNVVSVEASTGSTGYVSANADDVDGNRLIIGSAKSFVANANGGLSKAAVTVLDAFVGVVLGGGAPAVGDGASELRDQYIGAMAEVVTGVLR